MTGEHLVQVTAEEAERRLRDLVFTRWQGSQCEDYEDTLKMTSLIDFYLPYFPLERPHVAELTHRVLLQRGKELLAHKRVRLKWDDAVVQFLVGRVEFAGPYPMDGAKGVDAVVTRYVARLLRRVQPQRVANMTLALSAQALDDTELHADLQLTQPELPSLGKEQ